jgi:hypothetical protein
MVRPSMAPAPVAEIATEQKFRKCRFQLVNYTFGEVLVRLRFAQLVDVEALFATRRTARRRPAERGERGSQDRRGRSV